MNYINNAVIIKRQVMVQLAKLMLNDGLESEVDKLPLRLIPKRADSMRCCVHHDRAVLKSRIKVLLGFDAEIKNEEDELKTLTDYVQEARDLGNKRFDEKILTVIDDACSACIKSKYQVTNACRGCVARPCIMNCPKKAIEFINGRAVINEDLCISCGICEKACPYHAIIYQPIPCEEACPVGAITKDETGKEQIDESKCVYCGKCMLACPFGAIMERSEIFDVLSHIKNPGKMTVAMVAPSIAGQFNTDFGKVVSALKKLGFDKVVEVAYGADICAGKEAAEFVEFAEGGQNLLTSSCCPAYVQTVKKHVPQLEKYVSHTLSPMLYTGEWVAEQWPDAVRVFIGPCVAKRYEAQKSNLTENVMSYEELGSLFIAASIDVFASEDMEPDKNATAVGRAFAAAGGVNQAVMNYAQSKGIDALSKPVDGVNKKSLAILKTLEKVVKKPTFVEVMFCEGGCLNGPGVTSSSRISKRFLDKMLEE
jgi:[FeFe] hydrogenase (group B1/B3)